ncbi:MAG: hypothetical protein ACJ763_01155 [Bdellovibrionia bacterium]
MNILLWVIQALLALHTAIGAVWKFSHTAEQTMPSLKAIPNGAWLAMSILELLFSMALILPAFNKNLALLAPIAAICIAAEMLLFSGVHLSASSAGFGPIVYWIVVAALCAFIVYGRFVLRPI